jgi:hypothetical protein
MTSPLATLLAAFKPTKEIVRPMQLVREAVAALETTVRD